MVFLDDAGVGEGHKEDGGEETDGTAGSKGDTNNPALGLVVETEVRRALVDNGETADGSSNEEPEGGTPHGPGDGVLADEHDQLDEHEDDGTEAARDGRGHSQTSKDGTQTVTLVPAPLHRRGTSRGNTHAGDGRDERVCRGDVGRVARTPHHPRRGGGQGTGKGQHLHAGVAIEGLGGDDAVLDGVCSAGPNRHCTEELEDGAEDHGLPVRDGARGHTGGPGVCNVIYRG